MQESSTEREPGASDPISLSDRTGHARHCFVAMPSGRSPVEKRWFRGWYRVVILPAVEAAGFEPILSTNEEQPAAINDEIRAHLAFDPMVVVDLGGMSPDDLPNPNVMYELGIRHAFGLPVVLMAWEGQKLPFDVANQRAIMKPRDILAQESNSERLVNFITAAAEGRYYRPMDAVGRHATLDVSLAGLGEDSVVATLATELKAMRESMESLLRHRPLRRSVRERFSIKEAIRPRSLRRQLWGAFSAAGGESNQWSRLLRSSVPPNHFLAMKDWDFAEWLDFLTEEARELGYLDADTSLRARGAADFDGDITDPDVDIMEAVRAALPPQPWPKGVHKEVAEALGVSNRRVSDAIGALIDDGSFLPQIDGVVYRPIEDGEAVDQ